MNFLSSLLVGILFSASVYMLLKKSRFEVLLGFAMLSNAVNLAILSASGWLSDKNPPILDGEYEKVATDDGYAYISTVNPEQYVDPIPQALILTAIVISFALISFLIVLIAKNEKADQGVDES